jgi:hypothetical protein
MRCRWSRRPSLSTSCRESLRELPESKDQAFDVADTGMLTIKSQKHPVPAQARGTALGYPIA